MINNPLDMERQVDKRNTLFNDNNTYPETGYKSLSCKTPDEHIYDIYNRKKITDSYLIPTIPPNASKINDNGLNIMVPTSGYYNAVSDVQGGGHSSFSRTNVRCSSAHSYITLIRDECVYTPNKQSQSDSDCLKPRRHSFVDSYLKPEVTTDLSRESEPPRGYQNVRRTTIGSYLVPVTYKNPPSRNSAIPNRKQDFDTKPWNKRVNVPSNFTERRTNGITSSDSHGVSRLPPAPSPYSDIDVETANSNDLSIDIRDSADSLYDIIHDYDDIRMEDFVPENTRKEKELQPVLPHMKDPVYSTLYTTQKSTVSTKSKPAYEKRRAQNICYTLIGASLAVVLTVAAVVAYLFVTGSFGPASTTILQSAATANSTFGVSPVPNTVSESDIITNVIPDTSYNLMSSTYTYHNTESISVIDITSTVDDVNSGEITGTTSVVEDSTSYSNNACTTTSLATTTSSSTSSAILISTDTTSSSTMTPSLTTMTPPFTSVTSQIVAMPSTNVPASLTENITCVLTTEVSHCLESMYNSAQDKFSPYPDPRNVLLWYHDIVFKDHPYYVNRYEAYFIKVLVVSDKHIPLQAVSKVGLTSMITNEPDFDLKIGVGDVYGTRVACPKDQIVCVEFKKGGQFSNGHNPAWYDDPLVEVSIEDDQGSYLLGVSTNLISHPKWTGRYDTSNDNKTFTFQMESTAIFDFDVGVYKSQLQYTAEEARRVGKERCLQGRVPQIEGETANINYWAIKFTAV